MSDPKFTQAHPIVNFPEVESSIQRFWRENGIFEKSLKNRQGCPNTLTDGYTRQHWFALPSILAL